jgi:hypothetical protein
LLVCKFAVVEAEAHAVVHESDCEGLVGFAKLRFRGDHNVSEQQ